MFKLGGGHRKNRLYFRFMLLKFSWFFLFSVFFFLLELGFFSAPGFAKESTFQKSEASVVFLEGRVFRQEEGSKEVPLTLGENLPPGSLIKTERNSAAVVTLRGKQVRLKLDPDSELLLSKESDSSNIKEEKSNTISKGGEQDEQDEGQSQEQGQDEDEDEDEDENSDELREDQESLNGKSDPKSEKKENQFIEPVSEVLQVELLQGSVFSQIEKVKDKKESSFEFRLKTKSAILGVRGTEFFVSYGSPENVIESSVDSLPKNLEDTHIWVTVRDGTVELSLPNGDRAIVVGSGETSLASQGGLVTPVRMKWPQILNWNMDPEKGSIRNNFRPGTDDYQKLSLVAYQEVVRMIQMKARQACQVEQ